MEATNGERVGVLVLRAWLEGPRPVDFRARIMVVREVSDAVAEPQTVVVASADAACDVVRAFVADFLGSSGDGDAPRPGDGTVTPG